MEGLPIMNRIPGLLMGIPIPAILLKVVMTLACQNRRHTIEISELTAIMRVNSLKSFMEILRRLSLK